MRSYLLILSVFLSFCFALHTAMAQDVAKDKGILIRSIDMEGFVLGDKERFIKIFKPYRNKYLTTEDMDAILQKIQAIYTEEGYQELVAIHYHVIKHRLVFTALMTS